MAATYKPNPNKTPPSRGTYPSILHHHRRIKANSSSRSRCLSFCLRAPPQGQQAREAPGSPRRPLGPAPGVGRSSTPQPQRLEQPMHCCKASTEIQEPPRLPEAPSLPEPRPSGAALHPNAPPALSCAARPERGKEPARHAAVRPLQGSRGGTAFSCTSAG